MENEDSSQPQPKKRKEHIFPATEITRLATEWKQFIKSGKKDEAFAILEEIVIKSTPMFERLAQHEGFNRAVDLDHLVSSAQSKVVKWLEKWDPTKGQKGPSNIFSWMSKCVAPHAQVTLSNGSTMKIKDIVDKKLAVKVLSYNVYTKQIVVSKVVGWHKNKAKKGSWTEIKSKGKHSKTLPLTKDHLIYSVSSKDPSDIGWSFAENPNNLLFLLDYRLSDYACQAITGMLKSKKSTLLKDIFYYKNIPINLKGWILNRFGVLSNLDYIVLPKNFKMTEGPICDAFEWMASGNVEKEYDSRPELHKYLIPMYSRESVRSTVSDKVNVSNIKTVGYSNRKKGLKHYEYSYDIEIENTHCYFANGFLVHNCAKNSFRCELAKVRQFQDRYHVTGDNLEKFFGENDSHINEDHAAFRNCLNNIFVRWGNPQEQGALKYLIECIIDDGHRKSEAIYSAACAWGISIEMSKFFYSWCLIELRNIMIEKVRIPFTEQDLFRHQNSYSHLVDLLDIITWDQLRKIIGVMGGIRLKIPTVGQLAKLTESYNIYEEISNSDHDPDSIQDIAKKRKKSVKTATAAYEEMVSCLNPERAGEYELYPGDSR